MANFSSNLINKFEREVLSPNLNAGSCLEDTIAFVQTNLEPEDIFKEKELENWATANGYVKADNNE